MARFKRAFAAAVITLLALTACGGDADETATPSARLVSEGEALAVGEIPEPQGEPVLYVFDSASGDEVRLDLATLERLRLEEWTLFEPFVERDMAFTGVPMTTLLDTVGVPDGATEVVFDALDDYQSVFTLEELRAGDVLLATSDDEGRMPIDRGGPIRIVFADGSVAGENPNLWIWSIRDMTFR